MGKLGTTENYKTIQVRFEEDICYLQIYRPEANNAINDQMIKECTHVLELCEASVKIVVLEGLPEVFCFGADFENIAADIDNGAIPKQNPELLYNLWLQLAQGPYVSVAHIRGKTNAGGIGFVAACDIVLCETKSVFSLSELLFDLMPACVLPFLIRRIGFSNAHYMTLMSQPISAEQAQTWGLVDAIEEKSENLLRKHLLRLKRLSKQGIIQYKEYMNSLQDILHVSKHKALEANKAAFSNVETMRKISLYVKNGTFPWEKG